VSKAYLLLEDGTRFDGLLCSSNEQPVTGEVVFTTAMSGYQESVTDPSYRGQILVFTYPHIGNYGVSAQAMESDRVHVRGVVMRDASNNEEASSSEFGWMDWLRDNEVMAVEGVDTRSLVRHIRSQGSMRGGIFSNSVSEGEALKVVLTEPKMEGQDLAKEVTPQSVIKLDEGISGPKLAVIDTGIKNSIVESLRSQGLKLEIYPCTVSSEELLAANPAAVFLANGPGDPAALDYVAQTVKGLIGKLPVFGICLGHQLLCRALGLQTYKLPFGHRGANHPVKDLATGKIDITSQNHGFAVEVSKGETVIDSDFGQVQITHLNLYDGTVEGIAMDQPPVRSVQHHPEAGPGPNDAKYLFDEITQWVMTSA